MDGFVVAPTLLPSPLRLADSQLFEGELVAHFRREGRVTFVTACQPSSPETDACLREIAARLSERWPVSWGYVAPPEIGLLLFAPITFACFEVQLVDATQVQKALQRILRVEASTRAFAESDVAQHGFLIDGTKTKKPALNNKDIVCHSFQHHPGVFYRFRYRRSRLAALPQSLADFFTAIPQTCPHAVFTSPNNARASAQELAHKPTQSSESSQDLLAHAAASISYSPYKTRHENLERYFLEHDEHCVATEVPVWAIGELQRFPSVTGHIDVLRIKAERIEIWDYKPNVAEEKMAALQVQLYCEMLAQRIGLPLTRFVAGYFDESKAYRFEPALFRYL